MAIFNEIKKVSFLFLILLVNCKTKNITKHNVVEKDKKAPNVLIIYPDQLRRYSAGFWSEEKYRKYTIGQPDPVLTPNIDKLAKNGVVFTNAISNFPLCSPARGMLLSGMYPEQNGIWNNCRYNRDESLRDDIPIITDLFFKADYNISYFGKCHWLKNDPLFDKKGNYIGTTEEPGGYYMNRYDTYVPPGESRHNIEYFYQSIRDVHFNPLVYSSDANAIAGRKDGEFFEPKIFSVKNEANKIITYLNNKNNERDANKPFFMMWSINPPHSPWDDKNTDMVTLEKYYGTDLFPKIDTLVVRDNADLKVAHYTRHYFANITSVDAHIGEVLKELKKIGELDNTIIVFSADHGEMMGSHGREGKNTFETESLGIPFIVHWPKGLKGGSLNSVLFSVTDVLPTTMGLAGLQKNIPPEVEGKDFSEILLNPSTKNITEPEGVLIMLGNARGIHNKKYTLCLEENKQLLKKGNKTVLKATYLYDNIKDPYQFIKIPLSDRPEIAKNLLSLLGKELKRTNDPWYQNKKYADLIFYN